MRHYNQRYAFLVSTSLDLRKGFGTATAVLGLMQALHRKGKRVGLLEPAPLPGPEPFRAWWFNRHLPREIKKLEVDCVVGIDFDGYRYARMPARRPFVAVLHGVKADEIPWESGAARARLARLARWERTAAMHADLVIAPSQYSCRRASELYEIDPARFRVVPNGIDLENWTPLPAATGRPTALAAARLIPRKGLDLLVRAWPAVRHSVQDAQLEIIGDGPERQKLEQLCHELGVQDSVQFAGVLSQSEFRMRLAEAHVFCFPSRQEAFGLAMLEAMASRRAIVALNAASLPEVVGDGALLVEPQPEALAEALVRVLSDRALLDSLALQARARAEVFTWERAASRFGEVLAEA